MRGVLLVVNENLALLLLTEEVYAVVACGLLGEHVAI